MSSRTALALLALALFVAPCRGLTAQDRVARQPVRAVMPKAIANRLPIDPAQDRVVVKLVEQRAGVADRERILAPDVLATIGGRATQPFFRGLERELTEIRRRQLAAAPPGGVPAVDLSLYFEVATTNAEETRELVRQLNALDAVELAYPRELPSPPPGDILPVTPDFTDLQGYRAPAPAGLDGHAVTATSGGMGAGITVLDIEGSWELHHEDLAQLRPSSVLGAALGTAYADHGTAVAGIISADADTWGVTGFSPDARFFVSTVFIGAGFSGAQAIANGLPQLSAGDVMVVELHTPNPLGYGPTEWIQADFDAIFIATGLGIVTVEAAGNGGVDLDSPVLGGLFDINVRDSGAIIVGASNAGNTTRASFSCHGSRVDTNGWGSAVHTTGYGDLFNPVDSRQRYTASFGGTSSATAIVSGAVCAVRGAAVAQLAPAQAAALDVFAIRSLLRATGTPIPTIGNRPDCAALFAAAGITAGLAVRAEPRIGQTCHFDLVPPFSATSSDLWAFVGSLTKDNQPMVPPWGGRILLGAPVSPLALGFFTATPATLSWSIPNAIALRGLRYYVQGLTFESASGAVTATNSVQCFVRR